MSEFIIGFFVFLIAVLLMGIGVLAGRRAIKGGGGHASGIPGVDPACGGACHNVSENKRCPHQSTVQT